MHIKLILLTLLSNLPEAPIHGISLIFISQAFSIKGLFNSLSE